MARWQPFDVVGGAYSDDTRPWTVQDTVNYLVVNAERPGGRSKKMLRGVPGLVTFSASLPESSVRGLYVAEGRLFAVVGTTLYRIATDGSATSLGTIPGVGRCVFTHNQVSGGNQVVIGNGQSGYVFNTTDDTLTQITDEGFPGFRSVDFADQYIIGVEPFGRYWFHSDLADATSYSTLDRAEAEKAPDRIQQAIATGSDILVLGERTGQFFYNTGEAAGTFQNRSGAEMDVGAGSPYTACRLDNTVYWLGNDGSVYRLNGYVPQRISTHALEQAISRCTLSDAYAFTFEDNGHKCYLLTFPDGQTWCFDAATQEWTRRESYGFNRWRVSALVKWGRHWIAGDFINGRLYQLDWRVQSEADEPLERRRITGVLHDDQNRMIVNAVEFVFDTGMDETSPPLPMPITEPLWITGNVPNGEEGQAISGTYTVGGGIPAYGDVTVISGTFPPGLTLNTDGTYSGAYTTAGSYSWTVQVTDYAGNVATVGDGAVVADVSVQRSLRPKVVSWWDFESDLVDKARGGNDFSGTVTYQANATASGNRLAEGAAPISTSTTTGYNLHDTVNRYTDCAFGARLRASKLTDCTKLITVGLDDGANVLGTVSVGITAGKWKASIYGTTGTATIFAASSVADAVVDTDTHVGLNMVWGGGTTTTLELWVNGAMVASFVASGALYANRSTYVIGTREGGGYRPAVAEMFWAHDYLSADEWAWLSNSGIKRFYADFGSVAYGTTYQATLAAAIGSTEAGIYTLDGTTANAASNPIAGLSLAGGAAYSAGGSPPAGLGVSQVVSLDGTDDRIENAQDSVTFGAGSLMMAGWFKQSVEGDALDVYLAAGPNDATQPTQFRRLLRQVTGSETLQTAYTDGSGSTFASSTHSRASRLNGWHMLGYGGEGRYNYPIINGIVAAQPGLYTATLQGGSGRFIVGSAYNGGNPVTGFVSSVFAIPQGNLRLSTMAKLYDLGAA